MRVIIVGNGIAGIQTAKLLRERSAEVEMEIYGAEEYPYYLRPRLTEVMGSPSLDPSSLAFYKPSWYEERRINVHLGERVERVNAWKKTVVLSGREEKYDVLVLANGSKPNSLPIDGANRRGVFTLRSLDNLLAIRKFAGEVSTSIVIGGGILGLEAAKGLKSLGLDVTVVEYAGRLLPRQLDDAGAGVFRKQVERLGIRIVLGASTRAILGDDRASGVELSDGATIAGGLILMAAGIAPDRGLAETAGLNVERGVTVNSRMQTSDPSVYAVGDCAEHAGRIYGIIPAALDQAAVAANNIMGVPTEYRGTIPSNTLKAVGIPVTSVGAVTDQDSQALTMVDEAGGIYRKVVVKDGKLAGAIIVGDAKGAGALTKAVKEAADLSSLVDQLAELGIHAG